MINPPVLALSNFAQPFQIECDASRSVIRVVLLQEGYPISFFSQALKGRELTLSMYEKKLLALVCAVQR